MIIDRFLDFITGHGIFWAMIFGFLASSVAGTVLFAAIATPIFYIFGLNFTEMLGGAIGCGIGSGIVGGLFFATYAD